MSLLPIRPVDAPLYVVTPIINPSRYRSRYALYRDFAQYITDAGAVLYTVEAAFGDRDFEITDADDPRHIRVRTSHEMWHKENLINIGVARLPADWKYLAWVDADVRFARPDIVEETIHQLQHFSVVQMFAQATDLGPRHEPIGAFDGFVAQWMRCGARVPTAMRPYGVWHPGYAWACRRDAWDQLGGLIDFGIVGSADTYMARGLIGDMESCLTADIVRECPTYAAWCLEWQNRAETYIRRNIGYVDGLLLHYFHGSKARRGYERRSDILSQNRFDPTTDLRRDWQGVWQLTDRKIPLRDQLRAYFRSRDEDNVAI
ncbi:hypothetical protein [Rhodopila globiformis]|uniref:Glycosyltransferase 2-like domain-containing protein n=1 Tax=Rhodopila globiformis TaxID=1071 RepID=A0A2S6NNW5_RHOGL|nr:hypothetical protein [Rhodopila globiformis]PPQ39535.1 hypothetical protein CCS01_01180 [Rhodopila globiformis]